jgi:hypothetical protein
MSSQITFRPEDETGETSTVRGKMTAKKITGNPLEGQIARIIGGGENAKNSFIWVTIRWSFLIGGLTTLALCLRPVYCQAEFQGSLLEDIKSAWAIFMPVITLALGYSFGKGK